MAEQSIFRGTSYGAEVRRLTRAWLEERWPSSPTRWRITCRLCNFVGDWSDDWSSVVQEAARHDQKCVNNVGIHEEQPAHNAQAQPDDDTASNGRNRGEQ